MKKFLSILGLLVAFSQPVFAQCGCMANPCNTCLPRVQVLQAPVIQTVSPIITGAACPLNTCNPCNTCTTGAAYAIMPNNTYCNPCQERKGFWSRLFGY